MFQLEAYSKIYFSEYVKQARIVLKACITCMQQKSNTHTHIYISHHTATNIYIYITQIICIIIIIGCPSSDKSLWVHHTNFASVIHRHILSLSHTDFAYVCISSNTHLLIKMKKREFGKRVCLHENMEGKVQKKKKKKSGLVVAVGFYSAVFHS